MLKRTALRRPQAYAFTLMIAGASIAQPQDCPATRRLMQFTIEDVGSMPVPVVVDADWHCNGRSGTVKESF